MYGLCSVCDLDLATQVGKKAKDLEKRLGHRLGNVTQHEAVCILSCVTLRNNVPAIDVRTSNVRHYVRHGIYQGTSLGIACVLAHQLLVLQMAVDLVVDPADIDTNLNDIGGLDDILERLVGHC